MATVTSKTVTLFMRNLVLTLVFLNYRKGKWGVLGSICPVFFIVCIGYGMLQSMYDLGDKRNEPPPRLSTTECTNQELQRLIFF